MDGSTVSGGDDLQRETEARQPFPQNPDEFNKDPRVSYSKLDDKWILEDNDGSEWEFNDKYMRWMPSLDQDLLEKQQQAYMIGNDNEHAQVSHVRKRKQENQSSDDQTSAKQMRRSDSTSVRKNTAVYVTGLPLDVTVDEVAAVFSKCGVIAEEIDGRKPRIKLYTDNDGNFKGDALVVYFRAESVLLALQMLDNSDFRFSSDGTTSKMVVREADFSYKKQKVVPTEANTKDKKKIKKKTEKLNSKLADWDDDDPSAIPGTRSKWDKVVILKHMFTIDELKDDPAALLDIKEDIRDECAKLGDVTNVILFDEEPEGVVQVRFGDNEAAVACVKFMDGRHFAGQRIEAFIANGSEIYKKSKDKSDVLDTENFEEEQEDKRLDEFGEWLEGQR